MEWLDNEMQELNKTDGVERLPTPKFEEGKITTLVIDASKPFESWIDKETGKVKAIIPCQSDIEGKITKCNWWLNKKNPVYKDVIHKSRDSQDKAAVTIKVLQTGKGQLTRYQLVRE